MWPFKKQVEHIRLQELSEYIDNRVTGPRRERVEDHLVSCAPCRQELDGLQYTVGLLQQVPMSTPSRRLIMQEAPASKPRPWVPSWAYGAAASVAAMLLVAIVGADLAGILPGGVRDLDVQDTAFSEAQFASDVSVDDEASGGAEAMESGELLKESQKMFEQAPEETPESDGSIAAKTTTSAVIANEAQRDGGEETHVLWRVVEGVLGASIIILFAVGLLRLWRSKRTLP